MHVLLVFPFIRLSLIGNLNGLVDRLAVVELSNGRHAQCTSSFGAL